MSPERCNGDDFGSTGEQARKARLFLDAYGCSERERTDAVELVPDRLRWLVTLMQETAAKGDPNFIRHIEEGHMDLYLRDIAYVESQRAAWRRLVIGSLPAWTPEGTDTVSQGPVFLAGPKGERTGPPHPQAGLSRVGLLRKADEAVGLHRIVLGLLEAGGPAGRW
ncbi:hypothetical protein ACFP1Z_30890 [Streptomyces gamaensis]|uniref:Uncharacterized protein n=1 Tax=Streptomyces gamaensis TaxID=1763542 RepID=A0ABW0ZBS2_9ACTN